MTAAATTGPASGPRPASSQPATGQMPRLISARSRRKLGGATAMTPSGSFTCFCSGFASGCFADLSRLMAAILAPACSTAQPGTREYSRYSIAEPASLDSIRQTHSPVVADLDAGRNHDFPRIAVGIDEIPGIASIVGAARGFQQRRAFRDREFEHRIDLFGRIAVPGERKAAEGGRLFLVRQGRISSQFRARKQRDDGAAGVEERHRLAGCAEFSLKAQSLIEGDAFPDVADAECDDGESRNRRLLTHIPSSPPVLPQNRLSCCP